MFRVFMVFLPIFPNFKLNLHFCEESKMKSLSVWGEKKQMMALLPCMWVHTSSAPPPGWWEGNNEDKRLNFTLLETHLCKSQARDLSPISSSRKWKRDSWLPHLSFMSILKSCGSFDKQRVRNKIWRKTTWICWKLLL